MNDKGQLFDSEEFKAQQRKMWDSVALGWQAWWPIFEQGAQRLSDKIVQFAEIKQGDKVLDIATGIGEPAITAARKVMPNGKVVAVDISGQMLSIAKTRANSLGLDNIIEFIEGDAEKLHLQHLQFDAVLSRWGLMLLPNLAETLIRIRQRMLYADGRICAAVWSVPSKVPLLNLAFSTVRKQIDTTTAAEPPQGMLGPFALADIETLKRLFSQAGFKDIRTETLQLTFEFDSPESYTRFHQQVPASIQTLIANHSEEAKQRAWDSITDAVWEYADSHGRVNIDNEVICIVARNR